MEVVGGHVGASDVYLYIALSGWPVSVRSFAGCEHVLAGAHDLVRAQFAVGLADCSEERVKILRKCEQAECGTAVVSTYPGGLEKDAGRFTCFTRPEFTQQELFRTFVFSIRPAVAGRDEAGCAGSDNKSRSNRGSETGEKGGGFVNEVAWSVDCIDAANSHVQATFRKRLSRSGNEMD